MVTKVQYQNESEVQQLIESNKPKVLVEVQNITEGNFLVFTDEISPEAALQSKVTEITNDISQLKLRDAQMQDDNSVVLDALITAGLIT